MKVINFIKKCLKKIYSFIKSSFLDIYAAVHLYSVKNKKNKGKIIRVGFIVQMYEIWDKAVAVYEAFEKKNNVEVVMLVVPPYDFENKLVTLDYKDNPFLKRYPNAVKAVNSDGSVIDVFEYNLEYVFYQRPYGDYLPNKLRENVLYKKIKCCYIPYGFTGADVFNAGNTNSKFFRHIYVTFLESAYMKRIMERKFALTSYLKFQHFEDIGYPSLEPYLLKFNNTKSSNTVLWTPRWSYDKLLGGSHFIEMKDLFLQMKEEHSEWNFIFRPHPLMFEELISKNLMSRNEIGNYLEKLYELGIVYDKDTSIEEAIEKSDILITDLSSIIVMYYLTGKPIIYCNSQIEFNEIFKEMAEGMYISNSTDDIKNQLSFLINGNDNLKDKRAEIIKSKFSYCIGSAERIADWIIDDYYK